MVTVVQGFGSFLGFDVNPSELLVRRLAAAQPDLVTEVLPCSGEKVAVAVPELVAEHRPDVWIGVGLAAGRTALSLEAVGVNLAAWNAEHADVDGYSTARRPVVAGGPPAHLTGLPTEAILGAWREAGIPGYLSLTAGSYMCNLSFYAAAEAAAGLGLNCLVGFLHVPLTPELVTQPERQPSMDLDRQLAGLEIVLREAEAHLAGTGRGTGTRTDTGVYESHSAPTAATGGAVA